MNKFLHRNAARAYSVIEIISIVVIVLIILGGFISWVSNYELRKKTLEAQNNIRLIFDKEVAFYQHSQPDSSSAVRNTKHFLPLSSEPHQPQTGAQTGNFTTGDWQFLDIVIVNPVYYSYSVETEGIGEQATFRVIAQGDLDGDGHYSRWEIRGWFNPNGQIQGRDQTYSLDPLD